MGEILVRALSLVAVIAVGYSIKRLRWVSLADFPLLSTLVLRVTLPAALITSFNDFDITVGLLPLAALGLALTTTQQVAGYLSERRSSRADRAFAVINTGGFNIGAFATPYLAGMMGHGVIVYTSIFDTGNAIAAAGWGRGVGLTLARTDLAWGPGRFVAEMFRSPVFDTYVMLLVVRLAGWHFPDPFIAFTTVVGNANPFLAMLMIGVGLEVRISADKLRRAGKYLAIRLAIALAAALGIWFLLPVAADVRLVLTVLAFAPIPAMSTGFTAEARGDVELSTFLATVTMLIGIVTMPALIIALGS